MRWSKVLHLVDAHCEGEAGRVVVGGFLGPPGETIAAKLAHLNAGDDAIRRLLCSEPRGAPAGSGILLPPSTRPEADTGFIVLQPDQSHAMSGSNAICATTVLLETGMVAMREPETKVVLDTAAGLVEAVATCTDGVCERVSLDMPPAYVDALDVEIETKEWGPLRYDLCFGGVFYALVDVNQLGLRIEPGAARQLATIGVALREQINAARHVRHPRIPEISGVAYVMFLDREPDGALRTCTCMWPGRVDRSPCGTGTTAAVAALQARGQIKAGERVTSRSIINGEFEARLKAVNQVDGVVFSSVSISGRAWIYGARQVGLDPRDPFPNGFTLSDVWGETSAE